MLYNHSPLPPNRSNQEYENVEHTQFETDDHSFIFPEPNEIRNNQKESYCNFNYTFDNNYNKRDSFYDYQKEPCPFNDITNFFLNNCDQEEFSDHELDQELSTQSINFPKSPYVNYQKEHIEHFETNKQNSGKKKIIKNKKCSQNKNKTEEMNHDEDYEYRSLFTKSKSATSITKKPLIEARTEDKSTLNSKESINNNKNLKSNHKLPHADIASKSQTNSIEKLSNNTKFLNEQHDQINFQLNKTTDQNICKSGKSCIPSSTRNFISNNEKVAFQFEKTNDFQNKNNLFTKDDCSSSMKKKSSMDEIGNQFPKAIEQPPQYIEKATKPNQNIGIANFPFPVLNQRIQFQDDGSINNHRSLSKQNVPYSQASSVPFKQPTNRQSFQNNQRQQLQCVQNYNQIQRQPFQTTCPPQQQPIKLFDSRQQQINNSHQNIQPQAQTVHNNNYNLQPIPNDGQFQHIQSSSNCYHLKQHIIINAQHDRLYFEVNNQRNQPQPMNENNRIENTRQPPNSYHIQKILDKNRIFEQPGSFQTQNDVKSYKEELSNQNKKYEAIENYFRSLIVYESSVFSSAMSDKTLILNPYQLKLEPICYWEEHQNDFTFNELVNSFFRINKNRFTKFIYKLYDMLLITKKIPTLKGLIGVNWITDKIFSVNISSISSMLNLVSAKAYFTLFGENQTFHSHGFCEVTPDNYQKAGLGSFPKIQDHDTKFLFHIYYMFVDKELTLKELDEIDKMIYFNCKNKTGKKIPSRPKYPGFTS